MNEIRREVDFSCIAEPSGLDRATALTPRSSSLTPIEERSLPSFFIVGPPRTGSSWLHQVLRSHTQLPASSKETRFFDTHFHRGLAWYTAQYEKERGEQRRGEVAPTYFASAIARERIAQLVPNAKIVCVFRNPVDRIVSLYRLKRAYGLIPWDFTQALERDPELMESGRYASHLKLWLRSFGKKNIQTLLYDDLTENPQRFLNTIADFIEVPRFELADWQSGLVHHSDNMTAPRNYYATRSATLAADWFKARRLGSLVQAFKQSRLSRLVLGGGPPLPKLSSEVLEQLSETFEPEVEELEGILRRDLSTWKTQIAA